MQARVPHLESLVDMAFLKKNVQGKGSHRQDTDSQPLSPLITKLFLTDQILSGHSSIVEGKDKRMFENIALIRRGNDSRAVQKRLAVRDDVAVELLFT